MIAIAGYANMIMNVILSMVSFDVLTFSGLGRGKREEGRA